jgi:hypothetical protein
MTSGDFSGGTINEMIASGPFAPGMGVTSSQEVSAKFNYFFN